MQVEQKQRRPPNPPTLNKEEKNPEFNSNLKYLVLLCVLA